MAEKAQLANVKERIVCPVVDKYAPPDEADVLRLVHERPLAWIVSSEAGDYCATALPLRPVTGPSGHIERLAGHFARSNRHVGILQRNPRAMILFLGPQGYISPSWMSDRTQAPTWNYASAQFVADIEFTQSADKLSDHLNDLVGAMEAGRNRAWSPKDMGARFEMLAKRVTGFDAVILERRVKFKLGQDERDDVYHDIMSALAAAADPELYEWMKRSNPGRS
jgi:transcriptional regulator